MCQMTDGCKKKYSKFQKCGWIRKIFLFLQLFNFSAMGSVFRWSNDEYFARPIAEYDDTIMDEPVRTRIFYFNIDQAARRSNILSCINREGSASSHLKEQNSFHNIHWHRREKESIGHSSLNSEDIPLKCNMYIMEFV